jgi:hypothetical protein
LNVELSKNVEEYNDDFEIESYEKQEGFVEGLSIDDVGKEMKKLLKNLCIK